MIIRIRYARVDHVVLLLYDFSRAKISTQYDRKSRSCVWQSCSLNWFRHFCCRMYHLKLTTPKADFSSKLEISKIILDHDYARLIQATVCMPRYYRTAHIVVRRTQFVRSTIGYHSNSRASTKPFCLAWLSDDWILTIFLETIFRLTEFLHFTAD